MNGPLPGASLLQTRDEWGPISVRGEGSRRVLLLGENR